MTLILFQLFASVLVPVSPTDGGFREIQRHYGTGGPRKEYVSPSGKFRITVATNLMRHARWELDGPGDYCLTREGQDVWCATLPYTLFPAAVFDDGTVVGTAYRRPTGTLPPRAFFNTFFHVVIIDPSGTVVLNEVTTQALPVDSESSSTPSLRAMFVDFQKRRLWLNVLARPNLRSRITYRILRVYDVDSGRKLSEVNPSRLCSNKDHAHSKLRICASKPLPGTGLMLVHGMAYDENQTRDGVFAVIDAQGSIVWQNELFGDYTVKAGGRRYGYCDDFLGKPPVLGAGDAPGSFWIRSVHDDARIGFEVLRDQAAKQWSVQKVSD